ncbi:hypothetical protein AGLY_004906 [Aphis glycines]|uniref:Uncharacterized protein n=1 Tax=Aphis glycines TaxID=307491 RepID=A0A6G0TVL6_APHGL|nr:hypothetical protein AGLY_004906 [Aphis glycines]
MLQFQTSVVVFDGKLNLLRNMSKSRKCIIENSLNFLYLYLRFAFSLHDLIFKIFRLCYYEHLKYSFLFTTIFFGLVKWGNQFCTAEIELLHAYCFEIYSNLILKLFSILIRGCKHFKTPLHTSVYSITLKRILLWFSNSVIIMASCGTQHSTENVLVQSIAVEDCKVQKLLLSFFFVYDYYWRDRKDRLSSLKIYTCIINKFLGLITSFEFFELLVLIMVKFR